MSGLPEARVFRPQSEAQNQLIEKLLKIYHLEGLIERASWTQYISYILNRDLSEVRARHSQRMRT